MDLVIKHAKDCMTFDKPVIIYGANDFGIKFFQEAYNNGYLGFWMYDQNPDKVFDSRVFISQDELDELIREGNADVIITAHRDSSFEEIKNIVLRINPNTTIYRYVSESSEEMISRGYGQGFFNGKDYVQIKNDGMSRSILTSAIYSSRPFLLSRWGTIEGDIVYSDLSQFWSKRLLHSMCANAGIFPENTSVAKEYTRITIEAAGQIDYLCAGSWCPHLDELFLKYAHNSTLLSSTILSPFFGEPWTMALENKKVLVIHPFAKLMELQYSKRRLLFDHEVLPDFTFIPYVAVQSVGGNDSYKDFFDALKHMQDDINKFDFDIALLGCGGYGMLLGAYIKNQLMKQAIHIGGTLQLLFGVCGSRWAGEPFYLDQKLYNEFWVWPGDDLKPPNYKSIENGCYW